MLLRPFWLGCIFECHLFRSAKGLISLINSSWNKLLTYLLRFTVVSEIKFGATRLNSVSWNVFVDWDPPVSHFSSIVPFVMNSEETLLKRLG